jgi:ubiquinone/menaquinone biosynthesis C-methylase UbiE
MTTALSLLPSHSLIKTGPVDHADWNYRPFLGYVSRLRYHLVRALLPVRTCRILEIGYGSGVFLPELARRCDELFGLDVHSRNDEVARILDARGVRASLATGSVTATPFESGAFDRIVAVSTLEFIDDLPAACAELTRILKPNGALIAVMPGSSPILDAGLKFFTGKTAEQDYRGRRDKVMPALRKHFDVRRLLTAPKRGGRVICIYTALDLVPRVSG